jgi:hypothetical protein
MSFGGRLAQIPSNPGAELGRRAWSSTEEFDRGGCAHSGPEDKRAPSSRAVFARGKRAGGEGGGRGARRFSEKLCGKAFRKIAFFFSTGFTD